MMKTINVHVGVRYLVMFLTVTSQAQAAQCLWTNTTGGVFSDPAMWNGGVPGINDTALFSRTASYTVSFAGNAGSSNAVFTTNTSGRVTLEPGAFTWTLNSSDPDSAALIIGKNTGSTSSVMLASGNVVTPSLTIGDAAGASGSLTVTNGLLQAGGVSIARGASSTSGSLSISNGQVIVNGGGVGSVFVGQGGAGTINITGGTLVVTNLSANGLQIGRNQGSRGSVFLSGDGQILSDGIIYVGFGTLSGATGTVVQTGGTWTHGGNLMLGRDLAIASTMFVEGGRFMAAGAIYVGSNSTMGSTFTVTNRGVVVATQVRAGRSGAGNHRVTVANGGLLEANSLVADSSPGCTISNMAGVFQFTTNAPQILFASGQFGRIAITNGTVSFRNIANADVKGNWSGSLTGMMFRGANTFRLDASTNMDTGQGYTFATGLGATNYARLELFNGANFRGGNVTIGAGGALTATGAVSTISSNLTFQPGGTYQVWLGATGTCSQVAVQGDTSLGGATLDVRLDAPPQFGYHYVVIDNLGTNPISGQFVSNSVTVAFGGTNYMLAAYCDAGNDLVVWRPTPGTVFRVR